MVKKAVPLSVYRGQGHLSSCGGQFGAFWGEIGGDRHYFRFFLLFFLAG